MQTCYQELHTKAHVWSRVIRVVCTANSADCPNDLGPHGCLCMQLPGARVCADHVLATPTLGSYCSLVMQDRVTPKAGSLDPETPNQFHPTRILAISDIIMSHLQLWPGGIDDPALVVPSIEGLAEPQAPVHSSSVGAGGSSQAQVVGEHLCVCTSKKWQLNVTLGLLVVLPRINAALLDGITALSPENTTDSWQFVLLTDLHRVLPPLS